MCARLRSDGWRITSVLYLELHHPIFRITSVLYLAVGKKSEIGERLYSFEKIGIKGFKCRPMLSHSELLSCGEREGVISSAYYYSDTQVLHKYDIPSTSFFSPYCHDV